MKFFGLLMKLTKTQNYGNCLNEEILGDMTRSMRIRNVSFYSIFIRKMLCDGTDDTDYSQTFTHLLSKHIFFIWFFVRLHWKRNNKILLTENQYNKKKRCCA